MKQPGTGPFPYGPLPGYVDTRTIALVRRWLKRDPRRHEALVTACPVISLFYEVRRQAERDAGLYHRPTVTFQPRDYVPI